MATLKERIKADPKREYLFSKIVRRKCPYCKDTCDVLIVTFRCDAGNAMSFECQACDGDWF